MFLKSLLLVTAAFMLSSSVTHTTLLSTMEKNYGTVDKILEQEGFVFASTVGVPNSTQKMRTYTKLKETIKVYHTSDNKMDKLQYNFIDASTYTRLQSEVVADGFTGGAVVNQGKKATRSYRKNSIGINIIQLGGNYTYEIVRL